MTPERSHGGEMIRLFLPLFGVVSAVWFLRLVLAAAGAPRWLVVPFSITLVTPASVLLAVVLIHAKRVGGYGLVALASLLLAALGQVLVALAVAFTMATGIQNVYSAPEFSPQTTDLEHVYGHLYLIVPFAVLGTVMGCVFLFALRVLVPAKTRDSRGSG